MVRSISTIAPWDFVTDPFDGGQQPVLRSAGGMVYVVNPYQDTITALDAETWTPTQVYSFAAGSELQDIAVVSPRLAYVTRGTATHLARLDLLSGVVEDAADLSVFADADGVPDMGMMAVHEGRLFVQIRRWNFTRSEPIAPPPYLAVVNAASGQLIDVDPAAPGVQAIELQGTAPKHKMHVVPQTRRLFVSASGDFFDAGGIEMIDLDTLSSLGMVVQEASGDVGADLGSFVMVSPTRGYLVFSTDLLISSHLYAFTVSGGVETGPELFAAVGYRVPTLVHDPQSDTLFFPDAGYAAPGVHVFDAQTGTRLTAEPIPTTGSPSDLTIICEGTFDCDDPNCASELDCLTVPAVSGWGRAAMTSLLLVVGTLVLARRRRCPT